MQGLWIADGSPLQRWKDIIEQWQKEIVGGLMLTNGLESAYVHAEHGNTHLFGVSASKVGYVTIREVIGTRNGNVARLDLALVTQRHLDLVESKWFEYAVDTDPESKIAQQISAACGDAATYSNQERLYRCGNRSELRIGLTFCVPYSIGSTMFLDEDLQCLLGKVHAHSPDLIAWSFPSESLSLSYWGRSYPGVVAIAKIAAHAA